MNPALTMEVVILERSELFATRIEQPSAPDSIFSLNLSRFRFVPT